MALPKAETKTRPLETYGCPVPPSQCPHPNKQFFYDCYAFAWRIPIDKGAPRRQDLFRRIVDVIAPTWFEWHDWTNQMVEALCTRRWVGCTGPASCGKTHNGIGFAVAWWLANPYESSVILCSTTAKAMRKRGWAEVQKFYTSIPGPRFGNFVDSQMLWKCNEKDDRHVIMGIAVEEGQTTRVADNIKGVHTKRQMVLIDEGTAVPAAIMDATSNLWTYPASYPNGEFVLVMLGNARSRLDEFGKFCEPLKGWASVTVEDEEWESKPQLDGQSALVLHFDAEKSPNITQGRVVSPHLPTKESVAAARSVPGIADSPGYWSNQRGFPPPEGLVKVVFSESALATYGGYDQHTFTGEDFSIIGSLDPARGGDKIILRFAALGEIRAGVWGIELMAPIEIQVSAASTNPIDYQIVEQVRRHCEQVKYRGQMHYCAPENLGVDATGGGADLCDIFQRVWSPRIMRIIFGGSPGADAVSLEDVRPANEVFLNKRAEMFFRARHYLDAGQLRGFDLETAREICTIEFMDSNVKGQSALVRLISKGEYRKRYGKSTDAADTVAMICEVAYRKGMHQEAKGMTRSGHEDYSKLVAVSQAVYDPNDSFLPEEDGAVEDFV